MNEENPSRYGPLLIYFRYAARLESDTEESAGGHMPVRLSVLLIAPMQSVRAPPKPSGYPVLMKKERHGRVTLENNKGDWKMKKGGIEDKNPRLIKANTHIEFEYFRRSMNMLWFTHNTHVKRGDQYKTPRGWKTTSPPLVEQLRGYVYIYIRRYIINGLSTWMIHKLLLLLVGKDWWRGGGRAQVENPLLSRSNFDNLVSRMNPPPFLRPPHPRGFYPLGLQKVHAGDDFTCVLAPHPLR